jgi:hypothetical protein
MIRYQHKLVQFGLIKTEGTSSEALVVQQKYKSKNPRKQHRRHNNKQNKGLKLSPPTYSPNSDRCEKSKSKNTDIHYNFCGKYGHVDSKCFKNMESLEEVMKKYNINIDSSSSSSHGHALSTSSFSFNATSTTSSDEWIIDYGASYHMDKDNAIFSPLNECNTNKIFVGDDRSLSVVGSGKVQVDNGHFNDVLCVSSLSCNLISLYKITHLGEGKTVDFSPHQVVTKGLEYLKHVLATGIADAITRVYKFDNFGSSYFPLVLFAHNDD